jgi:formate/nitrite transporter FocA (FNT family)
LLFCHGWRKGEQYDIKDVVSASGELEYLNSMATTVLPDKAHQEFYNLFRQQISGIGGSILVGIGIWAAQKAIDGLADAYVFLLAILAGVLSQNAHTHLGDIEVFKEGVRG